MPFLLHLGAEVICEHGGQAEPTAPFPRVLVSGMPITLQPIPYVVAGCAMPPPPVGDGPCITAFWETGATRVTANGMPVLLQDSLATCVITGTPLTVIATQTRVQGM